MANSLLTINMITREALRLWKNTNSFLQHVSTQYDDQYARVGAKIGSTLRIRLPNDYVTRTGPAVQVQNTTEVNTSLVLATQKGVDVSFTTAERELQLDDYSRRVLAPMVNNLVGSVAADLMSGAQGGISNYVSNVDSGGNIIGPVALTYLLAGAALDNMSAPQGERRAITDPKTMASSVSTFSGLLNPAQEISEQYRTGMLRTAWGMDFFKDQTVIKHVGGTYNGAATVSGGAQSGASITITGGSGTLVVGDIVTFAGSNAVNRITKQSTQTLMQFVVTAAMSSGGTSVKIYPSLVPPDVAGNPVQYQTVDASPTSGGAVLLVNPASTTYIQNFLFVPDAVTIAFADLEEPRGVHEVARESYDGVSMRMLTDYVVATDQMITRLDVLYGYAWLRPEWACIIADNPTNP